MSTLLGKPKCVVRGGKENYFPYGGPTKKMKASMSDGDRRRGNILSDGGRVAEMGRGELIDTDEEEEGEDGEREDEEEIEEVDNVEQEEAEKSQTGVPKDVVVRQREGEVVKAQQASQALVLNEDLVTQAIINRVKEIGVEKIFPEIIFINNESILDTGGFIYDEVMHGLKKSGLINHLSDVGGLMSNDYKKCYNDLCRKPLRNVVNNARNNGSTKLRGKLLGKNL